MKNNILNIANAHARPPVPIGCRTFAWGSFALCFCQNFVQKLSKKNEQLGQKRPKIAKRPTFFYFIFLGYLEFFVTKLKK